MRMTLFIFIIFIVSVFGSRLIMMKKIKIKLKIDKKTGIEEEIVVEIGGIQQYLNIRGQDVKNPVILVLHGSMPMTTIIHSYQKKWEENYTVVNWDRRGAGETYYLNKKEAERLKDTLTFEQMLLDTDEVVDYLRKRFHKDKIILLADSEGTVFAPNYVQRHSNKIIAYVGSAQINQCEKNMKLCQKELMEIAKNKKDIKAYRDLETMQLGATDGISFVLSQEKLSKYAEKYICGSSTKEIMKMIIDSWFSPYGKITHMGYFGIANEYNMSILDCAAVVDFVKQDTDYAVPMIFIYGKKDWITSYTINSFFEAIEAPEKHIFIIEKGGHNIIQTDSDEFYETMNLTLHEIINRNS